MKHVRFVLAGMLFLIPCSMLADGIGPITVNPSNPTDLTPVTFTVSGYTGNLYNLVYSSVTISGNTIRILITAHTGSVTAIGDWTQNISMGTLAPGTYQIEASLLNCQELWSGGYACIVTASTSASLTVNPHPIEVTAAVSNTINCSNPNALVPVAILSTPTFDARSIDHATVRFGPGGASEVHQVQGVPKRHEEDVNGDGLIDLVFHFRLSDAGIGCEAGTATIIGSTFAGLPIQGTGSILTTNASIQSQTEASEEKAGNLTAVARLGDCYPNPFNPTTTIPYTVSTTGFVSLKVYNMLGQEVARLVNEIEQPGKYSIRWDAKGMPSGMYAFRLTREGYTAVRTMLLVK